MKPSTQNAARLRSGSRVPAMSVMAVSTGRSTSGTRFWCTPGGSGSTSSMQMRWWIAAAAASAVVGEALEVLQVERRDAPALDLLVVGASFGASLPMPSADQAFLGLVQAEMSGDCSHVVTAGGVAVGVSSAILMDRGGLCSFVQKAAAVQNMGASLLVVGDNVEGAYQAWKHTGHSVYDCSLGQATLAQNVSDPSHFPIVDDRIVGLDRCSASGQCESATCIYTGASSAGKAGFEVCCFINSLVRMSSDPKDDVLARGINIAAVFASYKDAKMLRRLVKENSLVQVRGFVAEESPWNISMLLTWLLGVLVVIGGAYCSATEERKFSFEKLALGMHGSEMLETQYTSIGDNEDSAYFPIISSVDHGEDDDRIKLSSIHALYFVVGSSSVLVLLYYGHLALLMNVMFMVATTASMAQVVILPILRSMITLQTFSPSGQDRLLHIVGFGLASSTSIYWFVHRSSASIWPLQDLLCITLCFVVIDTIHLPSLKVASVLLGAAFVYDIFFVYVSPLIFGSSVMVEVASGRGSIQTSADQTTHERLPMVLSIPLLYSYYGGNALLGLGDLILPGLLVSLCIRYDYCMAYPLSRSYFIVSSLSYALGLLLANVMAIALRDIVEGQPALMYIVPIMLSSIVLLAVQKQELHELWRGPECLQMELALAISLNKDTTPRREEVEPFLKRLK